MAAAADTGVAVEGIGDQRRPNAQERAAGTPRPRLPKRFHHLVTPHVQVLRAERAPLERTKLFSDFLGPTEFLEAYGQHFPKAVGSSRCSPRRRPQAREFCKMRWRLEWSLGIRTGLDQGWKLNRHGSYTIYVELTRPRALHFSVRRAHPQQLAINTDIIGDSTSDNGAVPSRYRQ